MVTVSTMARLSSSRDISFETVAGAAYPVGWSRDAVFSWVESSAGGLRRIHYLGLSTCGIGAVVRAVWGAQDRFRALHVGGAVTLAYVVGLVPSSRYVAWRWIGFWPSRCAEAFPRPEGPAGEDPRG